MQRPSACRRQWLGDYEQLSLARMPAQRPTTRVACQAHRLAAASMHSQPAYLVERTEGLLAVPRVP